MRDMGGVDFCGHFAAQICGHFWRVDVRGLGKLLCVRAPAYPPAAFFYLVTSASLWYLGGFGKLFEAARAAHDRMMFVCFVCARPRIHQLIFCYLVTSASL